MTNETTTDTEMEKVLSMPDEEIANMVSPEALSAEGDNHIDDNEENTATEEVNDYDESEEQTEEESNEEKEEIESEETESEDDSEETDNTDNGESASEDNDNSEADTDKLDYEAFVKAITSPIKANGKEVVLDNPEDIRKAISMGLGYNKRMAALKPVRKVAKLLADNDLMDEEKVNFLIDLANKKPEAISKLLADSDIDPLDLDTSTAEGYKPTQRTVDDSQLRLEEVLETIKESPSFDKTIDVIGNVWDDASKRVILENPDVIPILDSQIENGIYDQIWSVIEKERALGKLTGISDIEAYKQIGDAMHANNQFVNSGDSSNNTDNTPTATKPSNKSIVDKKKAAASKTAKSRVTHKELNPLAMSDEEFEKYAASII